MFVSPLCIPFQYYMEDMEGVSVKNVGTVDTFSLSHAVLADPFILEAQLDCFQQGGGGGRKKKEELLNNFQYPFLFG